MENKENTVEVSPDLFVETESGFLIPASDKRRCIELTTLYGQVQLIQGDSTDDILEQIKNGGWVKFHDPVYNEEIWIQCDEVRKIGVGWVDMEIIRHNEEVQKAQKIQMRANALGLNREQRRLIKQ